MATQTLKIPSKSVVKQNFFLKSDITH